ncbi:arad-like aldolase/epimerase [Stipitochalara longipes BDJ]|nr:arad-like aldolase/epimerase [Stipitochalara longipes BDJ]
MVSSAAATLIPQNKSATSIIMHEASDPKAQAEVSQVKMPTGAMGPTFATPHEEREYQKVRLALAFRIFAKLGFDEGVAGHITLRDPVHPTTFWVNPFGVAWPTLKASDLIRVDGNGTIVEGGPGRNSAFMIHHAVHTARPDVNCVAHAHSIYGRTFCALGRPLDFITQDVCAFYDDIALYSSFRGVVLAAEEGTAIAEALGSKKAALLQNHGLLTTGKTIEAAVFWFLSLEKCCQSQLMADAAAGGRGTVTIKIDDQDAAETYKTVGSELAGWFSAKPTFDMMALDAGEDGVSLGLKGSPSKSPVIL